MSRCYLGSTSSGFWADFFSKTSVLVFVENFSLYFLCYIEIYAIFVSGQKLKKTVKMPRGAAILGRTLGLVWSAPAVVSAWFDGEK